MRKWPKVSVSIIAYNQEKYISQAIDSVLSQCYPGELEIIIRDDCSTDNTSDLIKCYSNNYANIKHVCLTENTYSLGVEPMTAAMKYATGEFIFLLEGDDYWTDPQKIRTVIDLMIENSINVCFHSMCGIDKDGKKVTDVARHGNDITIFTPKEVILGGPAFINISGMVIKKSIFEAFPSWFYNGLPFGDYFIQVIASLSGGAIYIPKSMGAYRINSVGSWTSNQTQLPANRLTRDFKLLVAAFKNLEKEVPPDLVRHVHEVAVKEYLNHALRTANNNYLSLAWRIVMHTFLQFPVKSTGYKIKTILKIIVKFFTHG